ncbi:hypothetical protein PDTK01_31770 [Phycicoccus sp. DTK01]|nr:hypothetical protein PDTK01_31770 [Phycicoccus sp. DTK01]
MLSPRELDEPAASRARGDEERRERRVGGVAHRPPDNPPALRRPSHAAAKGAAPGWGRRDWQVFGLVGPARAAYCPSLPRPLGPVL